MSEELHNYSPVPPSDRTDVNEVGSFFPGEAARLLGLADLDYRQLRRLFRLARGQAGGPVVARRWSRYTLVDLASVYVAVQILGLHRVAPGRRLRMAALEAACAALSARGFTNPLLQVPMMMQGDRVLVILHGEVLDPVAGQQALNLAMAEAHRWIQHNGTVDQALLTLLRGQRMQAMPGRVRRRAVVATVEVAAL